jgi:hypothetical protein
MYESFLQFRVNEIHCERLQEAAAQRLAREARAAMAKAPAPTAGIVARVRRSLGAPVSRPI